MTDSTWVPIRDSIERILSIGMDFFAPIAAIAVSMLGLSPGVAAILRGIPAIMAIVEEASPAAGTGPAKSAAVMKAAEDLMAFAGTQVTGQAKVNFEQFKPIIQATINSTITLVNKVAPQIIANDPAMVDPTGPQVP